MNERRKKLLETMKKFNKDKKDSLLDFAVNKIEKEIVPFGIKRLDDFLGGGSVAGTFTVIYGGESVGKATLVLQKIAECQKQGKLCCYIDLEHSFDKERAIKLGINLENLVLAETCRTAEEAMEIVRTLCIENVVDVIVVDSIQAMSPKDEQQYKGKLRDLEEKEIAELARKLSKFFRVVAPDVFRAKADVIMIGQVRIAGIGSFYTHADMTGGEALKHWAYIRLFMRRGQGADAPVQKFKEYYLDPDGGLHYQTVKDKIGFDCVIKIEKTKSSDSAKEGTELHIPFYYKTGFNETKLKEEIPIKIEGTKEEKEKIKQILKEKNIYNPLQEGYTPKPLIEEGEIIPPQGGTGEIKIKKKSRGRPKKEKK